ncbi:MAG: MBL fold metallo-hydrolase [Myxococcales bacterium]|nr:MBL fold metallo-hydrolase [Myxococcales bacterium]
MSTESDLYFRQLPVGEMANFAYLIGSRAKREALLVDPAWSVDALLDAAEADGMRVTGALVTHYHQDHVGGSLFGVQIEGIDRLMACAPVPIYVNENEAEGLRKVTGASESDLRRVRGGDVLELGALRIRLLHTPGHTPGSHCFLVEEAGAPARLVSGDTLFLASCGRVDLPGSDPEAMYRSLTETLKRLPDDTLLYPGHFYSRAAFDTLGNEKRNNPFLRMASLDQFLSRMGV